MFIAMNRFKVIKEERKAFEDLWVTRESHLVSTAFSIWMTSARMAFTFLVGAFGAVLLLTQFGTGQAQLLRGSEPVTAKSQRGDDAARRPPLDSGASNDLGCANPLAEGARANVFVPPERPRSDRRHKGKPDRANEGGTALQMTRLPRSSWIPFSARGKRLSAIGASPTAR